MSDEEGFGYEYDSGGGWSDQEGDEEQNENEVLIINTFYEAEQSKDKNPEEALEKFETVILLEEQEGKNEHTFKSLEYIVIICCKIGDFDKALDTHQKLLKMVDKVARNDKSAAITNILQAVNDVHNNEFKTKIFDDTLGVLKGTDTKMWMDIQIKLGKLYLENQEFTKLDQLIFELKKGSLEGSSSEQDNSYLLEVYSLEIQLCVEKNDSKRLRAIYRKSL